MAVSGEPGARWRVFVPHSSELRNFPAGGKPCSRGGAGDRRGLARDRGYGRFPGRRPACCAGVRGAGAGLRRICGRAGHPVWVAGAGQPEVSYTELEFDAATAAGLPRLVFVLDTTAADVGIPLEQLIDHASGPGRRRSAAGCRPAAGSPSCSAPGRAREASRAVAAGAGRGAAGSGPPPPGSVLRLWNIPARNRGFTGRDDLLAAVREQLVAGDSGGGAGVQGRAGWARPSWRPSTRTGSPRL